MGLRAYLVKRAAQTVITIVIVLVLMFVLFRIMPGDPTSLLLQPGLTPNDRDALRVTYGFARWETAPGVFKQGGFTAADPGLYSVAVDVTDSAGNEITLSAAYVNPPLFPSGSPIIVLQTQAQPSMHVTTGTPVSLSIQVVTSDPSVDLATLRAWALVTPPGGGSAANVSLAFTGEVFRGTFDATNEVGVYVVDVTVVNPATGTQAAVPFGFAVNPPAADIAPFFYVEDEDPRGAVFTAPSRFTAGLATVTVIVLSTEGDIEDPVGRVVAPDGTVQSFDLTHPLIAVERPAYEQFWFYMVGMFTGNFGTSFQSGRPVIDEIGERIGPTLILFGTATILSILMGIAAGVLLAWFRGSRGEVIGIVSSLFFYSMPIFWFGLLLLYMFAFTVTIFPLGGFGCVDLQTGLPLQGPACLIDVLWHMILPLLTLVIVSLAFFALLMRNSLLEVLGEDFVTVARAKGLRERTVMYRHAARNAMLPVTTVVALSMAGVISGGVLTETIFSWPGMGFYLVQRTLNQDFPAVQAAFYILALLTILGNVVADVAYAYLDPRVRL
jgi:peptide/nickel transport system permease protein